MTRLLVYASIGGLSFLCILADVLLKRAALSPDALANRHFALGTVLYAVSAFGWVYVLRFEKLATIGALYSIILIIGLAAVGVIGFHETLSEAEYVGLACAVAALVLLGRFA